MFRLLYSLLQFLDNNMYRLIDINPYMTNILNNIIVVVILYSIILYMINSVIAISPIPINTEIMLLMLCFTTSVSLV